MRRATRSPARRLAIGPMVVSLCVAMALPAAASAPVSNSWTAQFGTRYPDDANGLAMDPSGNLYVIGQTSGELPGQKAQGMIDCFVRRVDQLGHEVWTRQFGTPERDLAKGVGLDDAGNVYVVGQTFGTLPGQTSAGGLDAFIRKYSPDGEEVWTRQFGGGGAESAAAVRVDHAGNIYVVGGTRGTLPGQTNIGDWDAFLVKFDPAGGIVWSRQFGTVDEDYGMALVLDGNGYPIVAGETAGLLAGAASAGGLDSYVRAYDPAGNVIWTRQFGSRGDDYAVGAAVSPAGAVLVAGTTFGTLPGQRSKGDTDAYVVAFNGKGGDLWQSQFGTSGADDAEAVVFDGSGHAFVTGRVGGDLPGSTSNGGTDVFLAALGPSGDVLWARQFGGPADDYALGLALGPGGFFLAGGTTGALPGQTNLGERDAFLLNMR